MEKNITLRGGQVFVLKYWKHLASIWAEGKVDPTIVVTHEIDLKDIDQAYDKMGNIKDNIIKPCIITKNAKGL